MTEAHDEPAGGEATVVDQSGRPLGSRALATRARLLAATGELLSEQSLRDLRVIDISRRVGSSAATFYQYFKDVEEAVLCLAEQAVSEMPALVAFIEDEWRADGPGLARARQLTDGFIQHWDRHHAVLRVRNLASDEGDPRFQDVRSRAMTPIISALAKKIDTAQRAGTLRTDDHPAAAAAALASILERLAAYHTELESFGVSRDDLVGTSAGIVYRTVTGRDA